jgi:uncharacterized protein with HEPN domain
MFVGGKSEADFLGDLLLRSAVERQFEILGEAMTRLAKRDPQTAERISEFRRIIGFRNVLIHGYDQVDDQTTWRIVQDKLPILLRECDELLVLPEDDQTTADSNESP